MLLLTLAGAVPGWSRETLERHQGQGCRLPFPSREQLARGETGDELWNAAQWQVVATGFMHNYLRMRGPGLAATLSAVCVCLKPSAFDLFFWFWSLFSWVALGGRRFRRARCAFKNSRSPSETARTCRELFKTRGRGGKSGTVHNSTLATQICPYSLVRFRVNAPLCTSP